MAQTTTFGAGRIARTETLAATLERAADYAAAPMHGAVTLEHLLLALTEDDDAVGVLLASHVDLGRLRNEVAAFIGQQQYAILPQGMRPGPDAELSKILTYAEAASRQSGRTEINGAIVLAAIVGEGRSMAATFLKAQGLTFQAAIKVIQQVLAPEPPPPAPAPPPAPPAEPPDAMIAPAIPGGAPMEAKEERAPPPKPAPSRPPDDERSKPVSEFPRGGSDPAIAGTPAPPVQKPLWEPVGIPSIRRPEPPARPVVPPRPAAPSQASAEPVSSPAPRPPERSEDAAIGDRIEPPEPAAKEAASERATPPDPPAPQAPMRPTPPNPDAAAAPPPALAERDRPALSIRERVEPMRAPSPPAASPPMTGRPPPLPTPEPPRRQADGPPPLPPSPAPGGGLGSARPPPPRPGLRLPPNAGEGHQITAPWPEPNDLRGPAPPARPFPPPPAHTPAYPPPPPPTARGPQLEHDHRAARGMPPPGSRGQAPPGRPAAVQQGQLIENIPRRMKVGVIETFEVRIARDDVADASRGLAGRGTPHMHALLVARAMSVRLQGEPGRFYIEASSPETQWTGSRNEQLTSDYAVWRFTVIPQRRGAADLTLIVSARTIGSDGVVADSNLPEQRITVRISANITRGATRWLGWVAVAVLGGVLAKLGEGFWEQGFAFVRRLLAI